MNHLSPLERFFSLFSEIKAGEGKTILLLFSNVFLILLAYYFIKPIREGWIAVSDIEGLSKVEIKAYSSFLQSIFLIFIVGWYAKLSDRLDKRRLFQRATTFCIANIVMFWLLQPDFIIEKYAALGLVYYLWVGMFGVFVVAQFWTFCADLFSADNGRRLMPVIAIGATSGAMIGSWTVSYLVTADWFSNQWLLMVAVIPLIFSIVLMQKASEYQVTENALVTNNTDVKASIWEGLKLIFNSRFLLLAALLTVLTNWVNTNGENLLFSIVQKTLMQQATDNVVITTQHVDKFIRAGTTAFYGDFYFWVNALALIFQAFFASRILRYGGFSVLLLILPIIALASYTLILLLPLLYVVKAMKVIENAADYSLNNTSRHVLWLPVSSQTKFHAKPAIDTLYVRLGDGFAALTVLIGVHLWSVPLDYLLLFNIFLIILWIIVGVALIGEYKGLSQQVKCHSHSAVDKMH